MAIIARPSRLRAAARAPGFVRSHALLTYFALTFSLSWGGMLIAVGPSGVPAAPEEIERLLPLAIAVMLTGPPVAGLLLTGLAGGRAEMRELGARLLKVRVDVWWYAVALLTAPLAVLATLALLSKLSSDFTPGILVRQDQSARLVLGITAALGAGIFEEIGWTGFVTPRLRRRHGVLRTGLILGLVWGAWHLLANVWSSRTFVGAVPAPLFVVANLFTTLLVYRVIMVWVYDRTRSLGLAIVMHASLTACALILDPPVTGVRLLAYGFVLSGFLWAIVVAIAIANDGRLTRSDHSPRVPNVCS